MILTRTPYRISFFGGGTDYPEWFERHGGTVLGATIDKYCWISVKPSTKFDPRFKVVYSRMEECDRLDDIQHPAVRECLRYFGVTEGVCVHHWGDLPSQSGMGSSSAFVVGLVNALFSFVHPKVSYLSKYALASIATYIERDMLGETVGLQDQILTAWGGMNTVRFDRQRALDVAPVHLDGGWPGNGLLPRLMLFHSGIHRNASCVAGSYVPDLDKHEAAMSRIGFMADNGVDCLMMESLDQFGRLLDEAWELKKSLGSCISNGLLDDYYLRAKEAGALGGKVLGAGGGGFMFFYVHQGKQQAVREALGGLVEVPFKFESEGSKVVYDDKI